jgi:hypothetical protein
MARQPNVLFVMTDQQRFDTIAALGNGLIHTPNLDRLVAQGIAVTEAYSTTPVCIPARYTIRSGCEAPTTGVWANMHYDDMHAAIERRCGPYLAARMRALGYRTWGVGKFHTIGWDADGGFEVQLHSEEFYVDAAQRAGDAYARFIAEEHPGYDWIEALMGERTEMYYVPQTSPLPAELTVEAWAADRAVELIGADDGRPWFGFVSFIGPHPPFAPPLPYNRMYDPDRAGAGPRRQGGRCRGRRARVGDGRLPRWRRPAVPQPDGSCRQAEPRRCPAALGRLPLPVRARAGRPSVARTPLPPEDPGLGRADRRVVGDLVGRPSRRGPDDRLPRHDGRGPRATTAPADRGGQLTRSQGVL